MGPSLQTQLARNLFVYVEQPTHLLLRFFTNLCLFYASCPSFYQLSCELSILQYLWIRLAKLTDPRGQVAAVQNAPFRLELERWTWGSRRGCY